jgi:hypothetical protein
LAGTDVSSALASPFGATSVAEHRALNLREPLTVRHGDHLASRVADRQRRRVRRGGAAEVLGAETPRDLVERLRPSRSRGLRRRAT